MDDEVVYGQAAALTDGEENADSEASEESEE